MLEPWLFLPCLFMFMWLSALLPQRTMLGTGVVLTLTAMLSVGIFSVCCLVLVWAQGKDEEPTEERPRASRTEGDRDPGE